MTEDELIAAFGGIADEFDERIRHTREERPPTAAWPGRRARIIERLSTEVVHRVENSREIVETSS